MRYETKYNMTVNPIVQKSQNIETNASASMNILFVVDGFYPTVGGAEKQVELLTKALHDQGHTVRVIAPHMVKDSPLIEDMDGIIIERIPYPRIKIIGALILVSRVGLRLLKERNKFDAIHIHMVRNLAAIIGLIKPWLRGNVVAKISGAWEFEGGVLDPELASKPLNKIMNILIRRIDYFQAISKFTVEQLKVAGYSSDKIKFIPNAIDTGRFLVDRKKQPSECINVVYTGRLEYVKGVDILLEAWAKVLSKVDKQQVKLLIAGAGNEQSKLDEIVKKYGMKDSVSFLGVISDIPNLLSQAHIYIQPSRQEGLSNSVLEAMAAGLPIVATRVSGNEDIVCDCDNGFLVEPENPLKLATAIIKLINNEELRTQLGKRSHEIVMQGYQLPVILKQLIQAYRGES